VAAPARETPRRRNDLDRRNAHGSDLYSSCLTVAEYNALGTWRRRLHRTAKHPAISLLVLPPLIFLVLYRFPFAAPRTWRAERRSVQPTSRRLRFTPLSRRC
jgi:omega-6 fatty acid desaturase (delta-12 desaturase)